MATLQTITAKCKKLATAQDDFQKEIIDYCGAIARKHNSYCTTFDEVEVNDPTGKYIIANVSGLYYEDGDMWFYEGDDINRPFYIQDIYPDDIIKVLRSLQKTGKGDDE